MINVLIAEDELLVRMGILSMINWENMGMKVVACVGDGLAALDDAIKYRPELIITDIVMPGLDGISMLRKVREQGLNPLSIVITALHQSSAAEHIRELNIVACLVKATMTQRDIVSALMLARSRLPEGGCIEEETATGEDMSEAYAALLRGENVAGGYAFCRSGVHTLPRARKRFAKRRAVSVAGAAHRRTSAQLRPYVHGLARQVHTACVPQPAAWSEGCCHSGAKRA